MHWREFQALQRVAEFGDRFLSYVDEGTGEPVVLLHGIPTWGYLWHAHLPELQAAHRVLIPDLLGYGYSDRSDRFDRSIAVQAGLLDAWMERLGLRRVALVGHDIGGGVALRLATLFPHRVGRLCLLNSVCYDSWPIEAMLQLGHPDTDRRLSAGLTHGVLRQAMKQGFARYPGDEMVDGLLSPYRTEVGKLSLIRNAAALNTNHTVELTPLLPRLEIPTLIVWGEEDRWQLVHYAGRLVRDIPEARLVRVRHARHFVMLDQPAEVSRHLGEFLGAPSTEAEAA